MITKIIQSHNDYVVMTMDENPEIGSIIIYNCDKYKVVGNKQYDYDCNVIRVYVVKI